MWLSIFLCYFSLTLAHPTPTIKNHITVTKEIDNTVNLTEISNVVASNSWICPSDASCYVSEWRCASNCSTGFSIVSKNSSATNYELLFLRNGIVETGYVAMKIIEEGSNDTKVLICVPKSKKAFLAYDKSPSPIELIESVNATFISGELTNKFISCTFSIPVISFERSKRSYELVTGEWKDELVIDEGSPLVPVENIPTKFRNISWAVDKLITNNMENKDEDADERIEERALTSFPNFGDESLEDPRTSQTTNQKKQFERRFKELRTMMYDDSDEHEDLVVHSTPSNTKGSWSTNESNEHIIDATPGPKRRAEDDGNHLDRDQAPRMPVLVSIIFCLTYLGFI